MSNGQILPRGERMERLHDYVERWLASKGRAGHIQSTSWYGITTFEIKGFSGKDREFTTFWVDPFGSIRTNSSRLRD